MKHQITSTKLQINSKHQAPNYKHLFIGIWDLGFGISQRGNIILLALLIMTGIVLAGGTIATLMGGEFRRGKNAEWALTSFYAAESGIEEALWRARKTTEDPKTWQQNATVGDAAWKRTVVDRSPVLAHPVILKNETKSFDLYNPDTPTSGAGGSVVTLSWGGATSIDVQLKEWKQDKGAFVDVAPFTTVVGGTQSIAVNPGTVYRLAVTASSNDVEDVRVTLATVGGDLVDLPTPLTVTSEGAFIDSRQTLKMSIPSLSYYDQPPPAERVDQPYLPPEKLCGLGPSDQRPVIPENIVLLTVGKGPLTCDYATVGDAIAAVPFDLVTANKSYIIEIRDNESYPGDIRIGKKTDATHTLTIRGAEGKQPTIASASWQTGIRPAWIDLYLTIENIRFSGNLYDRTAAIDLQGTSQVTIRNNTFTNFKVSSVIRISGGRNNIIEQNLFIANPSSRGVGVSNDNGGNIIRNNTFVNTAVGVGIMERVKANTVVDNIFFVDGSLQSAIALYPEASLARAQGWTIDRNHYFVDQNRQASVGRLLASTAPYRTQAERYDTLEAWRTTTGFDRNSDTNVDLTNPLFVRWREVRKTVCAEGCDFTTITGALAAMPGHVPQGWREFINDNISYTIEIQDGRVYPGDMTVSPVSDIDRRLTITSSGPERPTIKSNGWQFGIRLYYMEAAIIERLLFTGDFRGRTQAIMLEGASRSIIRDNIFTNFHRSSVIRVSGGSGNTIEQNQFVANLYTRGVTVDNSKGGNVIRNNIFTNNAVGIAIGERATADTAVENTFFVDGSIQSAIIIDANVSLSAAQRWTIDRNHYFIDQDRGASVGRLLTDVAPNRTQAERYDTLEAWRTATGFDRNSDTNVDLTNPLFVRWREVRKTVCAEGCDFTDIQSAMNAMPSHVPQEWRELINDNISYTVEVQDSRVYVGSDRYAPAVNISAVTDPDRQILLTAKIGERPTIKPGNYQKSVRVYYTSDVTVQGFRIAGPNNSNFDGGALWGEGADRIQFIDNIIEDIDAPAMVYQGGNGGLVERNFVRNTTRGVFMYSGASRIDIRNNIFESTKGAPLALHDGTSWIRIENNIGWNNPGAISVSRSCANSVCNHTFRNNIFNVVSGGQPALWFEVASMPTSIASDYNSFVLANGAIMASIPGTTYAALADWVVAQGKDAHSISEDPLFANVTTQPYDYHLRSTVGRFLNGSWVTDAEYSPSIDAGDPASIFANEPAPNGGRVDQGVYGDTAEASKSAQ